MSKAAELIETINEMSRGLVVLDENLAELKIPLMELNIRVLLPPKGMSDEEIKHSMLSRRLFITNNSKDFVHEASSYEYGIIATEHATKDTTRLAKIISKALIDYDLWSKQHGFILKLMQTGKHEFTPLTK